MPGGGVRPPGPWPERGTGGAGASGAPDRQMGISHEYDRAYRRTRQRGKYTKLKIAGSVAAILVLSLGITAILETAQRENNPPMTAASSASRRWARWT